MPWYEIRRPPTKFEVEDTGSQEDIVLYKLTESPLTPKEIQSWNDAADTIMFHDPSRLKSDGRTYHTMKMVDLPETKRQEMILKWTEKIRQAGFHLLGLGCDPVQILRENSNQS